MSIHHYMVEYEDDQGVVQFANDTEITSLTAAKSLASSVSKDAPYGAYVVAFGHQQPIHMKSDAYVAIGHISFFNGKQSDTDGTVI